MSTQHQGITDPPVDRLLTKADSKYGLVIFSARRARQINAYYSQLHEGLFEYVGPLVDTQLNEKPLSIALREIEADLLVSREAVEATPEADLAAEDFGDFSLPGEDDPFATLEPSDAGQPVGDPEAIEEAAETVRAEEGTSEDAPEA